MVGTTRDEWQLFNLALPKVPDDETIARRLDRMTDDAEAMLAAYRAARPDATSNELWCAVMTDRVFRIPAIRLAEAQAPHQPHTYSYLFTWASKSFDGLLGSCHALEIPFAWNNLDKRGTQFLVGDDPPQPLATAMHEAWTAFARNGDPGHPGIPTWPAYDPATRGTMAFDEPCAVLHDPGSAERASWDHVL
jgi:para-nitrobenzyl esterase